MRKDCFYQLSLRGWRSRRSFLRENLGRPPPPPPKKKKMEVGGGGGKVSFSPLPLLLFIYFYFCSRSTFRALSRAKSLGTQVIIN